jgi:hypothetical protein
MDFDLGVGNRDLQGERDLLIGHAVASHQDGEPVRLRKPTQRPQNRGDGRPLLDLVLETQRWRGERFVEFDVSRGALQLAPVDIPGDVKRYAFTVASRMRSVELQARRKVSDVMSSARAGSQERYIAKRCTSRPYLV